MRTILVSLIVALNLLAADSPWRIAIPGWKYEFPRDHYGHGDFKTEWWYFTGNLTGPSGQRLGFELTFFREGIIPPTQRDSARSRFVVNDLKFAHLAVTDATNRRFRFLQKASRGAFGEAGCSTGERIAWIDDWSLELLPSGDFHLRASAQAAAIDLVLTPRKKPAIHGQEGVSLKAAGEGRASHYYSITRLETRGTVRCEDVTTEAKGESWFDHEWASNQLALNQSGWNWLCAQLQDGSEIMLYQLRLNDGTIDPVSSGSYIAPDGSVRFLASSQFSMSPVGFWKSDESGARYPLRWQVNIPDLALTFAVQPVLDRQELVLAPLTYWEGAVDLTGNKKGVGYLELTGYAGTLRALTR